MKSMRTGNKEITFTFPLPFFSSNFKFLDK